MGAEAQGFFVQFVQWRTAADTPGETSSPAGLAFGSAGSLFPQIPAPARAVLFGSGYLSMEKYPGPFVSPISPP